MQMDSRGSDSRPSCAECPAPAKVGSRCIHCYVSRFARRLDISKYKWFKAHRKKFELMLGARFTAIEYGGEPPDPSLLVDVFIKGDGPRMHHTHGVAKRSVAKVLKIIAEADAHARRKNENIEYPICVKED